MKLTRELRISELRVFSDSQLIVGQVQGELEERSPSMASYIDIEKELKGQLLNCNLQHIPRSENARADRLAKLATIQMEDLDPHVHVEALEVCSTEEPK